MGRYHTLFYSVFTIAGIVYFCILLFQEIIISTIPQSEFLIQCIAPAPGMILYVLAIILISAIIICGAKKIYANLRSWSEKN